MTRRTHAPRGAQRIAPLLLIAALALPACAFAATAPAKPATLPAAKPAARVEPLAAAPPILEDLPSARWPNPPATAVPSYWKTRAEKTDYRLTSDYEETMRFCKLIEAASAWVKVTSYGKSGQGRDLPLVIVSKDGAFTPDKARATGKPIILVQNGIHAGEIEGKDASLALLRDLTVLHRHDELLDNVILLVLPIFSVDAHERRSPYNRINQNGPDEMGWRFTPIGLNLNRDYLKVETPEMRALIGKVYTQWWPHLLIDDHTTDGADYRHDLTLAWNRGAGAPEPVGRWMDDAIGARVMPRTVALGHLTSPYLSFRRGNDPASGIDNENSPPRFSTGYTPLQCRPSLLVETHMLKPYVSRVQATYDLLLAVLEEVNARPRALTDAVAAAEAQTIARGRQADPAQREVVLTTRTGERADSLAFKGWVTRWEKSDISGAPVARYTAAPWDTVIPFYRDVLPGVVVREPAGYVLPQEWTAAIDRLDIHGVRYRRFTAPWRDTVEVQHVLEWSAATRSFEGHRPITVKRVALERRVREARPGDLWIPLDQRSAAVAVNLLEAQAPDGLMYWNVFDTVFEFKEYGEDYIVEPIARRMLHDDPSLAKDFQARLAADTSFAKSPQARIDYFYRRSPWADPYQDQHPALRALRPPPESVLGR